MMDYLDTLLGAGIAGAFFLWGRRSKKPYLPEKVEAICGCGDHRSFHKDDGACQYISRGNYVGAGVYAKEPCTCQQYRGPKTYSEVLDEEIE